MVINAHNHLMCCQEFTVRWELLEDGISRCWNMSEQ